MPWTTSASAPRASRWLRQRCASVRQDPYDPRGRLDARISPQPYRGRQHAAGLVDYRTTTKWAARRIRNTSADPVELLIAESPHAHSYHRTSAGVAGFWDSL